MSKSFLKSVIPFAAVSGEIYGGDPFRKPVKDTPLGLKPFPQNADKPVDKSGWYPVSPQLELQKSPEAQRALDFLQTQIGKKINIFEINDTTATKRGVLGGFDAASMSTPEFKTNVNVLLNSKNAGYETLFHEVGHARDPKLKENYAKRKSFNPKYIDSLRAPSDRLSYFVNTTAQPRVESETEAQAYSADQLPRFSKENPDINIPYQKTFDDPWFKEYPASYASQGIDRFYDQELYGGTRPAPFDENSPAAVRFMFPVDSAQRGLSFALDSNLQKTEKDILERTREFIDERLNPYQSKPTPAAPDYWASRK